MVKTRTVHETKALTSGAQATIQVPTGGKIMSAMLRFATGANVDNAIADIKSEIALIKFTVNGQDIVSCTPTKLFDLLATLGQRVGTPAGIAGMIELNLGKLLYKDPGVRDLLGFGTNDVQSIQIAVTAGTLVNVASVTAITERLPVVENFGMHCRYINYPRSFNATGDDSFDTMPRDPSAGYLAVLVDAGSAGTITDSEVKVGNIGVREKAKRATNGQSLNNDGYVQQTGYYAHMFTDGQLPNRLPMVNVSDLRFINTFSVAPGAGGYNQTALTVHNLPSNI